MINKFLKYRFLFFLLLLLLTVLALFKALSIEVNSDVNQFFPEGDPDLTFYELSDSEFKGDEHLIVIGIKNQNLEFNTYTIKEVLRFSDSLKKITNIKKITGLTNLSYPFNTPFGFIGLPYLKINENRSLNFNKERVFKDFDVTQNFINEAGNSLFLWVEFNEGLENNEIEKLINDIETLKNDFSEMDIYFWGREFIDFSFKKILKKEIKNFGLLMFLFMCVALTLIFKKPIALLFPTVLVSIVIILFLGGMVGLGRSLGTMSNLFPTIILIVGISDVVHMCIKYNAEQNKNLSPLSATKNTLKEIGWTTFITSFTTAVGFFVLCISPMKAMRNFGLESGIVIFLTYIVTLILLPVFFITPKKKNLFLINGFFENLFSKLFREIKKYLKYPNRVLLVFGLLLVVGIYGIFLINTNSHQYSIPKKSQLWDNYAFFESNFGGSRTFELVLSAKKGRFLNEPELLKIMDEIHEYLSRSEYLNSLKSPMLFYHTIRKAYHSDNFLKGTLIENKKTIKKYEKQFHLLSKNNYLINNDKTWFKFNAQMTDHGRDEIEVINKQILDKVHILIGEAPIIANLSGIDFLIDKSHKKSINSMLIGLLLSIIVVGLTLGLIFRNNALILLTLLLNFIPIIITAGIMGYTNLELRGEISLIFIVGFVIAVDDTIHLLSKFQWERKKGKNVEQAMDSAILECGKAILATSIILIGGFFILMISGSLEIFTLGLLVGIIVLITLSVDLILAPVLVSKWFAKYL